MDRGQSGPGLASLKCMGSTPGVRVRAGVRVSVKVTVMKCVGSMPRVKPNHEAGLIYKNHAECPDRIATVFDLHLDHKLQVNNAHSFFS